MGVVPHRPVSGGCGVVVDAEPPWPQSPTPEGFFASPMFCPCSHPVVSVPAPGRLDASMGHRAAACSYVRRFVCLLVSWPGSGRAPGAASRGSPGIAAVFAAGEHGAWGAR